MKTPLSAAYQERQYLVSQILDNSAETNGTSSGDIASHPLSIVSICITSEPQKKLIVSRTFNHGLSKDREKAILWNEGCCWS